MTTPNCNKDRFKSYFLYRLRSQLTFLIITFVLNFCSVVLLSIETLQWIREDARFNIDTLFILFLGAAVAQFAITFIGGTRVFDHCLNKASTDTFYSLPIKRSEMFRGDFLSGYISHVATLIPCSVISMIIAIYAEDQCLKLISYYGSQIKGSLLASFAEMNLALFFSYTFAYVLSVIITICCGRKSSSIKYTLSASVMILVIIPLMSNFAGICRLENTEYYNTVDAITAAPPLGTFFLKAYKAVENRNAIISSNLTMAFKINFIPYLIYIPVIAALIAVSYFIFKHRKPESTGTNIAVNGFYRFFAEAVTFILISFVCYCTYRMHMWWLSIMISLVVGCVSMLIFTLARKPKKSDAKKCIIRGGTVIISCIAVLFIIDKTGVFGTRYYNISPNKTESIEITIYDNISFSNIKRTIKEELLFTEQEDIEKFISSGNKTLRDHSDSIRYGNSLKVIYNLADGSRIERSYEGTVSSFDHTTGEINYDPEGLKEMIANIRSLPGYSKQSATAAFKAVNNSSDTTAVIFGKFGVIDIPAYAQNGLQDILRRDITENFDIDAEPMGIISAEHNYEITYIPIQADYIDTIDYIESLRTYDGKKEALSISYYGDPMISVKLKIKHLEQNEVKELLTLVKVGSQDSSYSKNRFVIDSMDGLEYYVPDENTEHFLDLILTIIDNNSADFLLKPQQ